MIARLHEWYGGRSRREQLLLLLMLAIAIPLLAWLLIVRPIGGAYDRALEEHLEAVDRHGRVLALADAAKSKPAVAPGNQSNADLELIVTEAASQAGIVLEGATLSAPNVIDVSVTGAKATAATQWLRDFEARGIRAQEMRMTPLPDGNVNLFARMVRAR